MTYSIAEFINEVIPTRQIAQATSKRAVLRIVENAPIQWDEQDFTVEEVTDYLWEHRAEYGQEDAE